MSTFGELEKPPQCLMIVISVHQLAEYECVNFAFIHGELMDREWLRYKHMIWLKRNVFQMNDRHDEWPAHVILKELYELNYYSTNLFKTCKFEISPIIIPTNKSAFAFLNGSTRNWIAHPANIIHTRIQTWLIRHVRRNFCLLKQMPSASTLYHYLAKHCQMPFVCSLFG